MRAVRFHEFGNASTLKVEDVATPSPGGDEVLVRVTAASVNPSDVKNVGGFMHQTRLPRTPGRDFAGTVVGGRADLLGKEVWGTGGDLGFTRDGSHAEQLLIPAAAAVLRPARLSAQGAASSGVTFVVAAYGLRAVGIAAGDTVVVIGVLGGVGRAVAQIARHQGASVIGVAKSAGPADLPPTLAGIPVIDSSKAQVSDAVRSLTGGRGADIVYDTVGGTMLLQALKLLAKRGRIIEIAAGHDPNVTLNLRDFYHQEARLFGVDSLSLDAIECASILRELSGGFETGDLTPPPVAATYPLEEAPRAYEAVAAGKGQGRHVLMPNP